MRDNVPKRPRVIVTVKRQERDGPQIFKIVGPNNTGIELRDISGMNDEVVRAIHAGAKEVKAIATLNRYGRWSVERVIGPGEWT